MAIDLNEDEIIQILKLIDESDFDELCLETENQKLVLRKKGVASSIQELQNVNLRQITLGSAKPVVSEEEVPPADHKKYTTIAPSVDHVEAGLVPVKAPILGLFYTTPRPGAPPFVEEGTSVTENDTVCIIEVMKVFNSVAAGARGVVAKVCVEHGKMVEVGQTLFLIRAEGEDKGTMI